MSRLAWQAGFGSIAAATRVRWVRGAALAGVLLFIDLIVALAIVDARFQRLVLLGLAGVALALVFRFPFAATCAVLLLVASVVQAGRWRVPFGPIELRLEELVIGALLIVAAVRPRRAWLGGPTGWALAAFLTVLTVAAYLGVTSGRATFSDAFQTSRLFAPVLIFFIVVRLFPEPEQVRRLLLAGVAIAAFAGFMSLLAAAPGSPLIDILNPNDTASIRDTEGFGLVNRVRLTGVALAYGLFWYAAVHAVRAQPARRVWWLVALGGMGVGIVLSFNRNMWVGIVLGLIGMLVLAPPTWRRSMAVTLVAIAAAGAAVVLSGTQLSSDSPVRPLVQRGATLFSPERSSRESSLQDRAIETRLATAAYRRHPVTGIGPGASFGSRGVSRTSSGALVREDAKFLHNQYLFLLLIGGPAALAAFVAFLLTPTLRVLTHRWPEPDVIALGIGVVITMVSAVVAIMFADPTNAAVLGMVVGSLVVLTQGRSAGTHVAGAPR